MSKAMSMWFCKDLILVLLYVHECLPVRAPHACNAQGGKKRSSDGPGTGDLDSYK